MFLQLAFVLNLVCLNAGCQTVRGDGRIQNDTVENKVNAGSTRNNAYSLLHQLLAEQKDVSKLRFIKHEHADLKLLVNQIAASSRAGAKQLELFAKQDASISLTDFRLPPAEMATRKAIAGTKQKELLHESGDNFELTLFLAQSEALTYASHLAQVTAAFETQPERVKYLTSLGGEMENLQHQLSSWMLSRMKSPVSSSPDSPTKP